MYVLYISIPNVYLDEMYIEKRSEEKQKKSQETKYLLLFVLGMFHSFHSYTGASQHVTNTGGISVSELSEWIAFGGIAEALSVKYNGHVDLLFD